MRATTSRGPQRAPLEREQRSRVRESRARWGGAKDLLLLFRVPHTPFLRVGPRFLSPARLHASAPSFAFCAKRGSAFVAQGARAFRGELGIFRAL